MSLSFRNLVAAAAGTSFDRAKRRTLTSADGALDSGGTSGCTSPCTWLAAAATVPDSNLAPFGASRSLPIDTHTSGSRTRPGERKLRRGDVRAGQVCVTDTHRCTVGAEPGTWGDVKVRFR